MTESRLSCGAEEVPFGAAGLNTLKVGLDGCRPLVRTGDGCP